ncbi:MAG: ATPase, T2SS/T4P/T4SS family [Cytophagales bacterium]|nr:ATPase, T2SS/T4P/T4SS family [Cytophagales bacterium]
MRIFNFGRPAKRNVHEVDVLDVLPRATLRPEVSEVAQLTDGYSLAVPTPPPQSTEKSDQISLASTDYQNDPAQQLPAYLESKEQLAGCHQVLSAVGKPLELNVEQRESCVVLDFGAIDIVVVCTEAYRQSVEFETLVANVRLSNLRIVQEWLAQPELIAELNLWSTHSTNVERDRGSEVRAKKFVRDVIDAGISVEATDIHVMWIKPDGLNTGESMVQFRIHGRLEVWRKFPSSEVHSGVATVFQSMALAGTNSHDGFSPLENQSCQIVHRTTHGHYSLRCQSDRKVNGLELVMRVQKNEINTDNIPTLEKLGYLPSQQRLLELAAQRSTGITIAVGKTGSGKSTLMRSLLILIPDLAHKAINSAEDPVEQKIPGVRQRNIQSRVSDTDSERALKFGVSLKTGLRIGTDGFFVGEIRDSESAIFAVDAAMSGHSVFTTFHAKDAVGALMRLVQQKFRIPPEDLAEDDAVNCITYQRLHSRLCPVCSTHITDKSISFAARDVIERHFQIDSKQLKDRNPAGCDYCRISKDIPGSGYKGLALAAEVLMLDSEMREAIAIKDFRAVRRIYRGKRTAPFDNPDMTGKTVYEHGVYLMSQLAVGVSDLANIHPFELYEPYKA